MGVSDVLHCDGHRRRSLRPGARIPHAPGVPCSGWRRPSSSGQSRRSAPDGRSAFWCLRGRPSRRSICLGGHPNYLAVIGEFVSLAILVGAPVSGVGSVIGFRALLRRRIRVEERRWALPGPEAVRDEAAAPPPNPAVRLSSPTGFSCAPRRVALCTSSPVRARLSRTSIFVVASTRNPEAETNVFVGVFSPVAGLRATTAIVDPVGALADRLTAAE